MFAETAELRDILVASEPVRSVLAMVPSLDVALLSAIDLSEQSKALEYEVISRETWASLLEAGAVGDICGHYLDSSGNPLHHPLVQRTINPPIDHVLPITHLILAPLATLKFPII